MNIVIIGGGTGSGKTTVAQAIMRQIEPSRVLMLSHDYYYRDLSHLPEEDRLQTNFDHPDSLETELLVHHLEELSKGRAIQVPRYNFATHLREVKLVKEEPREVTIVEGILTLAHADLRDKAIMRIFVDTPADVRFIRRLKRDVKERKRTWQSVVNQYMTTVRPMHEEFVEPSKLYADIIVPEGGHNPRAIEMLAAAVSGQVQ